MRASHGDEGPESTRPALLLVLAGPALLGAAVYAVTLGNQLVQDDPGLFRYLAGLRGISDLFAVQEGESHVVLTYLSADASARANASLGLALLRDARPGEAAEYLEKATVMQPHVQAYRELLGRAREEAKHPPVTE